MKIDAKSNTEAGSSENRGDVMGLRRIPTQRRSRERVERMLGVATKLIVERGLNSVRMSEIAKLSRVSIGSIYQYFPDKTSIVMTLAERYNAQGRACVEEELSRVSSEGELERAMLNIVDGYYQMFLTEPVMQDIWRATQADKVLQELDTEDCRAHASLLHGALVRLRPEEDADQLYVLASLLTQFVATAVRLAISQTNHQGADIVETFKRMLNTKLLKS